MPKMAKRASKPSKRAAKQPDHQEPEVLGGGAAVATDPLPDEDPPRTVHREERSLDLLYAYLNTNSAIGIGGGAVGVETAVTGAYGGTWDPQRELAVLKLLKEDGRFIIVPDKGGRAAIALAGARAAAATQQSLDVAKKAVAIGEQAKEQAKELDTILTRIDEVLAKPAKTLGEHVADAQGRPLRVPWNVEEGSRVLLLTDGYPPSRAVIRNIHTTGNAALYDLTMDNGGTTDGVPAYRIGRDPEADDEVSRLREHLALERRHRDRGKKLAQRHVDMVAVEKQLAESLSKHRKAMQEVAEQLAEHARSEPGQTDLRDLVGDGEPTTDAPTSRGDRLASEPSAAEDKLAPDEQSPTRPIEERIATGEPVELGATKLSLGQLQGAALNQSTASTGKPQQIKPVAILGEEYVLGDQQGDVAVLLPLYTSKQWAETQQPTFGHPKDVPTDTGTARLESGGRLNGTPVRVGRATRYVGAEADAVLVRVPRAPSEPDAPEKRTGKDAAAGD